MTPSCTGRQKNLKFPLENGTMKFLDLFGRLRSVVIGMIHVKALPGKNEDCLFLRNVTFEVK